MPHVSGKSLYLHFLAEVLSTDDRFSQTLEANALALLKAVDASKARVVRAEAGVREFAAKLGVARLAYTPADPIGAMVEAWSHQVEALNGFWSDGVCDMEQLGPDLLEPGWAAGLEQQEALAQGVVKKMASASAEFPARWRDALGTCKQALAKWKVLDEADAHRHAQGVLGQVEQDWQQLRERADLTLAELHKFWISPAHKKLAEAVAQAEQECEALCEKARVQREREEQARKERERIERERIEREREEQARKERERIALERKERERVERERQEQERLEQERQRLEREAQARKDKEKRERERKLEERLERERKELERLEKERLRLAQEEKERPERERLERERELKERLEQERKESERLEQERQAQARKAADLEAREQRKREALEQKERERQARELQELERLAAQRTLEAQQAQKARKKFFAVAVGTALAVLGYSVMFPEGVGGEGGGAALPPQAAWLKSGLYGHDNAVAGLKPVRITETKNGRYSVTITNQFGFACAIEFNAKGDPARLRACRATTEPGWTASPSVIDLRCDELPTEVVCRGKYELSSGSFTSASEMVIARKR